MLLLAELCGDLRELVLVCRAINLLEEPPRELALEWRELTLVWRVILLLLLWTEGEFTELVLVCRAIIFRLDPCRRLAGVGYPNNTESLLSPRVRARDGRARLGVMTLLADKTAKLVNRKTSTCRGLPFLLFVLPEAVSRVVVVVVMASTRNPKGRTC